jgi:hypothetical protein
MRTPTPHATLSSALTQTVISTAVEYPFIFEAGDDVEGFTRDGGTISIDSASPCTITCVAPSTTILVASVPIQFTALSDVTKGIALNTIYYITNINVGLTTFQLSSTIALARAGTADINTTGAITGTFECVSRLYVKEKGNYEVIISGLIDTTGITGFTPQFMDVWFCKGNSTTDKTGTNAPKSNTQIAVSSAGVQSTVAVAVTSHALPGDFIRLAYRGSDTRIQWLALPAITASGSTPAIPACPSLIATIKKIGR